MNRHLLTVILTLLLVVLTKAVLTAAPWPLSHLDPVLMLIAGYIVCFRFNEAMLSAATAGLAGGVLSGTAPVAVLAILLLTTLLLMAVFTRVLTNISVAAFAALNGLGLLSCALLTWAYRSLLGQTGAGASPLTVLTTWTAVLLLQMLLAALGLRLARRLRRRFTRLFIIR